MSTDNKDYPPIVEDILTFLEKTLIEAYLKGKGHTLEDLHKMPEEEVKHLMTEAFNLCLWQTCRDRSKGALHTGTS